MNTIDVLLLVNRKRASIYGLIIEPSDNEVISHPNGIVVKWNKDKLDELNSLFLFEKPY